MPSTCCARQPRRGFTLPEVLLALSVILVAALPIIANLGVAIGARRVAQREASAASLADRLSASLSLAMPEVLRRQSGLTPGAGLTDLTREQMFWDPANGNFLDPGADRTEFDASSRFNWLHAGFYRGQWSQQFDDNMGNFPREDDFDDAPLEPFLELDLEGTGFDARLVTRVSQWRYEIAPADPQVTDPNDPNTRRTVTSARPREYDYAVFLFDEGQDIQPDIETYTRGTDPRPAPQLRASYLGEVGEGVELASGDVGARSVLVAQTPVEDQAFDLIIRPRGSKVLLERAAFPESLREATAAQLGLDPTDPGDVNDPLVDAELQNRGYYRRVYRTEFVNGRRPTVISPEDIDLYRSPNPDDRPVFNLFTLPARVYAINSGKVQL
ncbi:MAG: type II secretion system protein [Planctomycetota bacterium]